MVAAQSGRVKEWNWQMRFCMQLTQIAPCSAAAAAADPAAAWRTAERDEIKASTVRFDRRFADTTVCLVTGNWLEGNQSICINFPLVRDMHRGLSNQPTLCFRTSCCSMLVILMFWVDRLAAAPTLRTTQTFWSRSKIGQRVRRKHRNGCLTWCWMSVRGEIVIRGGGGESTSSSDDDELERDLLWLRDLERDFVRVTLRFDGESHVMSDFARYTPLSSSSDSGFSISRFTPNFISSASIIKKQRKGGKL